MVDIDIESDVTDSNLLPATDINIIGLKIDGVTFLINEIFASKEDFVSYLNTTFVLTYDIDVLFSIDDPYIQFESTEIETIEVMAIYQNYMRVYQIGTPDPIDITVDITATFDNGDPITHATLADEVLQVSLERATVPPLDATGYTHDPEAQTLSFGASMAVQDTFLFVWTKQVPA